MVIVTDFFNRVASMFTKTTAAKLGKSKSRILGSFTKVQEELNELLEKQNAYNNTLVDKIRELEQERAAVNRDNTNTQRLLKKINEFLD